MKTEIDAFSGHTAIRCGGEVDLFNAGELKSVLLDCLSKGSLKLVVNLSGVAYIDSTGIGALLAVLGEVKKRGGQMKLAELSPAVNKVFQLTRLTSFFEIYASEREALETLSDH